MNKETVLRLFKEFDFVSSALNNLKSEYQNSIQDKFLNKEARFINKSDQSILQGRIIGIGDDDEAYFSVELDDGYIVYFEVEDFVEFV